MYRRDSQDKEWQKVKAIYKTRDFQMPENIKSPEDYISVEMLYMQKLSDLTGKLVDDKDYNLRSFSLSSRWTVFRTDL